MFKRACSPSTQNFPDIMPERDHSTCFLFSSLCRAHRLSSHRNMKPFCLDLFWQVTLSFALILYYLSPPAGQEGGSWLVTCLETHSSFELKHCNHWGILVRQFSYMAWKQAVNLSTLHFRRDINASFSFILLAFLLGCTFCRASIFSWVLA